MLFLALLCGLGAAALRGFQLANSFDPQTALIEPGDPLTLSLMALSAVFTAAVAVYVFLRRKKTATRGKRQSAAKPLGNIWLIAELTALAALASASVLDLIRGFSNAQVSAICLGVLGLAACGALLMIALNINRLAFTSATGFWATVPVFWSCFMMIVEFWGHAGDPVRNTYVYGMLATVFCTLALYTAAGFFFDRVKTGRALLYALPGVFFALLTFGGALLGQTVGDPLIVLSFSSLLRFAFIALHLSAVAAAILFGRLTPPEPEPEDNTEEEKEAL